MKYFQISEWVPNSRGSFKFNNFNYPIILRQTPLGWYIHFPSLRSNILFFWYVTRFKDGYECMQRLYPISDYVGGVWPYLPSVENIKVFCQAIEDYLDNKYLLNVSIY